MSWLNRTTKRFILRNSPSSMEKSFPPLTFIDGNGFPASNAEWIADPDISAVTGFETKYWIITGDSVTLMDQASRDAVDVAELAALTVALRNSAINPLSALSEGGISLRSLIETFNKRDNYLVNRIEELQLALDAVKATTGTAQSMRDAIPATWLATNTRTRAETVNDYTNTVSTGQGDT